MVEDFRKMIFFLLVYLTGNSGQYPKNTEQQTEPFLSESQVA